MKRALWSSFGFLLGALAWGVIWARGTEEGARRASPLTLTRIMDSAMVLISDYYVENVDLSELLESAIDGMVASLDPHSQFMRPKDTEELSIQTTGDYGGVGMIVGIRDGWPTVISPFEGTPAYRMGLRPGDRIVEIEGENTYEMDINEVVGKLRGEPGTQVTIKIWREGLTEPLEITLTREIIVVHAVPFWTMLEDKIGYIKLSSFSGKAEPELRAAIDSLKAQGARKFILDLRMNPGGLLGEAVAVADLFLPKGAVVVSTKGREPYSTITYHTTQEPEIPEDWPVVILVDRGSASASEIVAGALQDWDRAYIIGDTTYGKGSVQRIFPLPEGYALRLTTSLYYMPSGRSIHRFNRKKRGQKGMEFTTKRFGRKVVGGMGVIPDSVIPPQTLSPLASKIISKGLIFEYAARYCNQHKPPKDETLRLERELDSLRKLAQEKGITFTECEWEAAKDQLLRELTAQVAEDYWGLRGRYRYAVGLDPVVAAAVSVLKRAETTNDLFSGF